MKICFTLLFTLLVSFLIAQPASSIKETKKIFRTYPFSDPNPIPSKSLIYPYFRFDGFTDNPIDKEWKVVELENEFVKLIILPEVGGKIWAAWEKSTGLPFLYNNQVVKFRDVAMRGPWTSGGIEPNYGIIGHTPNCATPVDYKTESKSDGSVSCYIGTFDKLTQTYWTIEVNLPKDKAYFTTHSTWHNSNAFEQPYYTWMNVGMPAKGNLEFIYPGTQYIGHEGEFADWNINATNKKNISLYEQNNFGGYKSYHVFGSYADFFGAFYHDKNFGMGRYGLYDEKPGRKIWIWGLSRQGMIWEKLLTDTDGQYVEIQSGRLFNQSAEGSMLTPFKNRGFAPYSTDEWTEYWFPVKGTGGMVKANPYGSLNIKAEAGFLKWQFSPLQDLNESLSIVESGKKIAEQKISFITLRLYRDSIKWSGDLKGIQWVIGEKFLFDGNPTSEVLSRPVQLPSDYSWDTPNALLTLGKEAMQGRDYEKAEAKFLECLAKDAYHLPALAEMSMLQLRRMNYEQARELALKALSIDTYDPAANFAYGLANVATNNLTDAKDAFAVASGSIEFRGAAYTELAKLYFRESQLTLSLNYARKAIEVGSKNIEAWQMVAIINRAMGEKESAVITLKKIKDINPLNHFVHAENYLWNNGEAKNLIGGIGQEMKEEVFLGLADWYKNLNRYGDALAVLTQAPQQAEILFWQAYLLERNKDPLSTTMLSQAEQASPAFVFPYRIEASKVMEWAIQNSTSWKPKYFLALIHWNAGNLDMAKTLFQKCGNPDYGPFHAAKASLIVDSAEASLTRAMQLDKGEWRYGKLLANYYLTSNEHQKALAVAQEYQSRFPDNNIITLLTVKSLLVNNQYLKANKLLTGRSFLPSEGSTEAHQLYRESLLLMAFQDMEKRNYSQAISNIDKARQWPENLGVGKPYESDLDERLEKFMLAICLEQMNKNGEAQKMYSTLTIENKHIANVYLLINALALSKMGNPDQGKALLDSWKNSAADKSMPEWCLNVFDSKQIVEPIQKNDQSRLLFSLMKQVSK